MLLFTYPICFVYKFFLNSKSSRMKKYIVLVLLLAGSFFHAYADEIDVSATVDENVIQLGQYLTYQITVQSENSIDVSEPRLPSVKELEFISRSQSHQMFTSIINGRSEVVRSQTFTYKFEAVQVGELVIPPADIYVENTSYKTNSIEIKVQEDAPSHRQKKTQRQKMRSFFDDEDDLFSQFFGSQKRDNAPPDQNLEDSFFVHVEVDKNSVYIGEQIIVSWYLYAKHNVTDINTLKYPLLRGFWKEDIQRANRLSFMQEMKNGMAYNKALLEKYALFPITDGLLNVDPYEIQCTIVANSFFGFGRFNFFRPQTYKKTSKSIAIQVKPLPTYGRPDNFSGDVGQYKLDVKKPLATEFKLNEPFTYSIKFTGKGNAKRIQAPSFELPEGLESYDTKVTSEYFEDGNSYKTFDFLFTPRRPGLISIPQTSFSYFDPEREEYVQQEIPAWQIRVLPSSKVVDDSHTFQTDQQAPEAEDVLPSPEVAISSPFISKKAKRTLWVAVYAALILILIGKALISFGLIQRKQSLQMQMQERWKAIYALESQKRFRDLGPAALSLINEALSEVATKKGETISQLLENIPTRLQKKIRKPLTDLIDRFETLSFAPENIAEKMDKEQVHRDLKQLESLLQNIFK